MLHGEHLAFKIISGDDIIYTPEEYKINKQVSVYRGTKRNS